MELAEPPSSKFDVHFSVGRIPARIHPLFWGVTLLFGLLLPNPSAVSIALWISAVLLAIVIHELGHAMAAKAYGWSPRIVLYGMGGLAIYRPGQQSWVSRAIIAAAGPGSGFLLAGLLVVGVVVSGHSVNLAPVPLSIGSGPALGGRLGMFVAFSMFVNVFWGLLNLAPVQPLDGGSILSALLGRFRPRDALALSFQVSMFAAGGLALLFLVAFKSVFLTVMFAFLAYNNWHNWQQLR